MKNRTAIFNTSLKAATLVLLIFSTMTARAQLIPLPNAFAHNDYRHKHPLYDALQNGYTNIEADIFLKGGRLIVAHINPYFKHNHTLEALYLKPLADRVANNNGQVYDGYKKPVILMIDIKTDSDKTYTALKVLLERYKLMLSSFKNGKIAVGAITVVLSGHKPSAMLMKEPDRLAFIDEDLRKASRDSSRIDVYQMASCKYSTLLKWRGTGLMPNDEEKKLCAYVAIAHKNGEKVRLWASPENNTVWQQLLKCGVDLINTDKLAQLKRFLLLQKPVLLSSATVAKPADNSQTALITL